jgi:peptidoglycan/xylan/chitin deacetylase (PgdA/CDA1 family)
MNEARDRGGRPRGAILCYHGLTAPDWPSDNVANVPAKRFVETVHLLRRVGRIVPPADLVGRYLAGEPTAGLYAITFDDAYRSLYDLAGDFVRRERVPIAVFPTIEGSEGGAPFWWDRVDDAFPRAGPERWRRFEEEIELPPEYRTGQPRSFGPVRPVRQWILAAWAGRRAEALETALGRLEADTGWRTRQRPMTFAELDQLASLPGVTIGVHTVSHPVLPLLSEPEQVAEIGRAGAALRERYSTFLPLLAAPFGLFDADTERLARQAGVGGVLTLGGGLAEPYREAGGVPRICVVQGLSRWRLLTRLLTPFGGRCGGATAFPDLPSAAT